MCEPVSATTALVAITAGSSVLQYQQAKQQAKFTEQAQNKQNAIAKANALQRYASEQLKIKQIKKQTIEKGFEASKKAKSVRSDFRLGAGERGVAMGGSINALMADYYRTEGNYKASLNYNYGLNVDQFKRNMEAIQFGAEAQSTYVTPPNSALLFATSALQVANTYYGFEADKQMKGLGTKGYNTENSTSQSRRLQLNQQYPADYGTF